MSECYRHKDSIGGTNVLISVTSVSMSAIVVSKRLMMSDLCYCGAQAVSATRTKETHGEDFLCMILLYINTVLVRTSCNHKHDVLAVVSIPRRRRVIKTTKPEPTQFLYPRSRCFASSQQAIAIRVRSGTANRTVHCATAAPFDFAPNGWAPAAAQDTSHFGADILQ